MVRQPFRRGLWLILGAGLWGQVLGTESYWWSSGGLLENERRPTAPVLNAEGEEQPFAGWALFVDNDLFNLATTDRDYTAGLSLAVSGQRAEAFALSDPWLQALDRMLGVRSPRGAGTHRVALAHGVELGLSMFTPSDIARVEPIPDDRPYAGLIYLASTRQYIQRGSPTSYLTSLSIGVLGSGVVPEVQQGVHRLLGNVQPRGWEHQISQGGELTARYSLTRQDVLRREAYYVGAHQELTRAMRVSVGYITELALGYAWRIGLIRTPWYAFVPQSADYAGKGQSLPDPLRPNAHYAGESYFWAGVHLKLRLYNVFLQGQWRDSAVTFSAEQLEPLIGELYAGYTYETRSGWRVSYFINSQSPEIKAGPASRSLTWGGIVVGRNY